MQKIWFITGISSGLGKSLAEMVIQKGDFVIGTFRNASQVEEFNVIYKEKALGLQMDVTKPDEIEKVFQRVTKEFGKLDILVNNAGIGFAGAIEEATLEEAKNIFEVNVFGALKVTQEALPIFRKQGFGHIFQMSSGAGIKASAGFGIYNASKFALEGFSEALADEVRPLGIQVTIVEPGPFRTNFAGSSLVIAQKSIPDYENTAGVFKKKLTEIIHNNQEGDPDKASEILFDLALKPQAPLRLPLGKMVLGGIEAKLESVRTDLENWREVALSAVY